MTTDLTLLDRLPIERAMLTVEFLILTLPPRSQRTILRELRANLRTAAAEVGAAEAVRRLGSLRRLAAGYVAAEYGEEGPRPRWVKGIFWTFAVELLILGAGLVGGNAYQEGVLAVNHHATGMYSWHSLDPVIPSTYVTYSDGVVQSAGIGFSLLMLPILLAAFVLGARAWRWLPAWRSHNTRP